MATAHYLCWCSWWQRLAAKPLLRSWGGLGDVTRWPAFPTPRPIVLTGAVVATSAVVVVAAFIAAALDVPVLAGIVRFRLLLCAGVTNLACAMYANADGCHPRASPR